MFLGYYGPQGKYQENKWRLYFSLPLSAR